MSQALPIPSPPLQGPAVVLRTFRADDYAAVDAAREHPQTRRWVNPVPRRDGSAMAGLIEELRLAGKLLHFVVADRETGGYRGEVLLFVRADEAAETGIGEIAYVVDPDFRGRGIAPSAVRLLSEWAFARLGLERLQLSVHPQNLASRRVAEKAGFSFEGTIRSQKLIRGRRIDGALYSRLPSDE